MRKRMPMLLLSFLLGVGFLREANVQRLVEPNSLGIRVVAENLPEFNIERDCRVDNATSSLDVGLDESSAQVRARETARRARRG
jgi:hypothetical protein